MNTFLRSAFLALPVLALSFSLQAQTHSQLAHLSGTLTDSSGAAVGDVNIQAKNEAPLNSHSPNSQSWSAKSSPSGEYSLELPPGRYRVQFTRPSFAHRELIVNLAPGDSHTLNLRLDLEPLSSNVVVTANTQPTELAQTPAAVDIVGHQEIDQRGVVCLTDLLQFSTGVAIGRTGPEGGTASVFLNGGNSNFTKVLVDGTPINPPGSGVDFSSLTTENIDKVEIVRGPESAIYGTDAVSGVIQLFTHHGETHVPAFNVYSEGGSYFSARGGADLSGLLGEFDYSTAASYFQTEGQGPNDAFLNRTLSGNFGYSFSDTNHIRLSLRTNTTDAGIPGATLAAPPDLFQGYGQHLFSANLRWEFATGSHWRHELGGTESYTRQHSFANPPDLFTYDTLLKFNRAGFYAQSTYVFRSFAAAAGYQYEAENGAVSFVSPGHLRRNNQAGYLDFSYSPLSRLLVDFGVRAEANASFGTRAVPRGGGSYVLRYGKGLFGDTRYRGFFGQGIKEPRFDQTFGTDPCFPGNPNLKPEASKGWSTGIDQKLVSDRLNLSADYFYNRFYGIVSFAPNPPPNPNFCGTYFNTDLAFARGVNFAAEFRVRKWLFVHGNYSYDDTRVLKSENAFGDPALDPGKPLIRRPLHSGSLGLNLYYARVNWNFIGYFTGARTDTNFVNPSQTNNPGYARFDMAASYNLFRGLRLTARATNLLDRQYQDVLGYPALGRDYRFGLRYQFSGRN